MVDELDLTHHAVLLLLLLLLSNAGRRLLLRDDQVLDLAVVGRARTAVRRPDLLHRVSRPHHLQSLNVTMRDSETLVEG